MSLSVNLGQCLHHSTWSGNITHIITASEADMSGPLFW